MTAAELLLEIGVEELPYQFIAPALAALKDSAEQLLKDQRLAFQSARTLGTPRRLTLVVEGLATQQTSIVKEAMGPSKAVAFDPAGQPTRAATGFAAGQGVVRPRSADSPDSEGGVSFCGEAGSRGGPPTWS